jgi:VanZ family protein
MSDDGELTIEATSQPKTSSAEAGASEDFSPPRISTSRISTSPLDIGHRYPFLIAFAGAYLFFSVFMLLMPLPLRERLWARSADLLHIPAFGILNFLFLLIVRQHSASRLAIPILVTLFTISLSGLIELIQGFLSRSSSLSDLLRNSLGATASLLIFKMLECWKSDNKRPRQFYFAGALAVIAIAAVQPIASIIDVYRQKSQFPVLANFASRSEMERWYVSSANVNRRPIDWLGRSRGLLVEYLPGDFPAIQLQQLQRDWSQYQTLVTELTHLADSPAESITIQLRITDRRSRRPTGHGFVERIELKRGQSMQWRFDLRAAQQTLVGDQQMRLQQINFVEYMAVEPERPAKVHFGQIRLEP